MGDAVPCIGDVEAHDAVAVDGVVLDDPHDDFAGLGELDGIADEVGQNLSHAAWVPAHNGWHGGIDYRHELEPLRLGRARQEVHDVLDDRAYAEGDVLDLDLSGLDLREVEDVVDDREQRL